MTMKAITFHRYGSPENVEVLSVEQLQKPEPAPDEVLVKVKYTTINRTDCGIIFGRPWFIRLIYGFPKPKHHISGTDFAGIVEKVGDEVDDLKPGDRVFGFDDSGTLGSHAEYLTIKAGKAILTIPESISFQEAAASAEGAHYAFNFINKVSLESGSKILLIGGTGAIGSACFQFLIHEGATVTVVAEDAQRKWIVERGAHKVYNYLSEDFTTDNERYDHVFDAVGKSSFGKCKHLFNSGGKYISSELGPGNQNIFLSLFAPVLSKKVQIAVPGIARTSLEYTRDLLEKGAFKPLLDRSYDLTEIQEGIQYADSGKKKGNVLLAIDP